MVLLLAILAATLEIPPDADDLILATATFQNRVENAHPRDYQARYTKGEWIKVSGFADFKYFYGQLKLLENRKVAGYLYTSVPAPKPPPEPSAPEFPRQKQEPIRQEQIYVYGEVIRPGEFRVFDQQGTLYRLLAIKNPR